MPKAKAKVEEPQPQETHKTLTESIPLGPQMDFTSIVDGDITPTQDPKAILHRGEPVVRDAEEPDTDEGHTEPTEPDPPEPEAETDNYQQRYEELQRRFGEQGTELGTLRQLVDQRIMSPQQQQAPAPPPTPVEDIDFLENPQAAIDAITNQVVERVTPQVSNMFEKNTGYQKLIGKHSDHVAVVNDPKFRDWALKTFPGSMLALADNDPDATIHILDMYKETTQQLAPAVTPQIDEKTVATKIATKRQAARTTGGVTPGPKDSGGEKMYSRIELMNMMVNDPMKYESMQSEILRAYKEGRVK